MSLLLVTYCLGYSLYIPNVGSYEEAGEVESKGWTADAYYREPEKHHEAISTNKFELGIFMLLHHSPHAPLRAQCPCKAPGSYD